jgi:hypothetical protein
MLLRCCQQSLFPYVFLRSLLRVRVRVRVPVRIPSFSPRPLSLCFATVTSLATPALFRTRACVLDVGDGNSDVQYQQLVLLVGNRVEPY